MLGTGKKTLVNLFQIYRAFGRIYPARQKSHHIYPAKLERDRQQVRLRQCMTTYNSANSRTHHQEEVNERVFLCR